MQWRKRTDKNHKVILERFRELGASVFSAHRVGQGFPDLVIGYGGKTGLVEVKAEKGKFTDCQLSFSANWKGSPVRVARNPEDCEAILQSFIGTNGNL